MILKNAKIISFGDGFWKENRMKSGKEIDLYRNQNIPQNSKTIDRTMRLSGVVSHKSTDVRRKSYAKPNTIYRLGMRFAKELQNYRGEIRRNHKIGASYYLNWAIESKDTSRVLEWFLPLNVNKEQKKEIEWVVTDAAKLGITVQIFQIED